MKNPSLYHYNYLVITIISVILIIMLLYAIFAKIAHDYIKHRNGILLEKFTKEIKELLFPTDKQQIELAFLQRLYVYYMQNSRLLKRGRERSLFEEALLQCINKDRENADKALEIANCFSFSEESIPNLTSNNTARRLKGCQQAGAYLYEAAIPFLFKILHILSPQLQYSALISLAEFGDPDLVVRSFEMIEHVILVNDRAVREIVGKMGNKKSDLFYMILDGNSPILVPLFLKFIDEGSANLYLSQIMVLAKSDDIEMRIAAIRALAETKNKKVLSELIDALEDEEWEVRAAAAKGIREIPDQQAYAPLLKAMSDSAWWVRQNAALTALSLPKPEVFIKEALQSRDNYAIDSLTYAANVMNMSEIINMISSYQSETILT